MSVPTQTVATQTAPQQASAANIPAGAMSLPAVPVLKQKEIAGPLQLKAAANSTVQLFKDIAGEAQPEISAADINGGTLAKLKEWHARKDNASWEWDDPRKDLVPTDAEKVTIKARIDLLEQQAAAAAKLVRLGVTQPQLTLFETTTNDEAVIKAAAATLTSNAWDIAAVLNSIAGASETGRKNAISVLAKDKADKVTTHQSVTLLALNWELLQGRDSLNVDHLVSLIAANAVIFEGGVYKEVALTGTKDTAYTFYANGIQKLRIDPEWHLHVTHQGVAQKPGFKKHSDKMNTGPGTRRETTQTETAKLKTALGM